MCVSVCVCLVYTHTNTHTHIQVLILSENYHFSLRATTSPRLWTVLIQQYVGTDSFQINIDPIYAYCFAEPYHKARNHKFCYLGIRLVTEFDNVTARGNEGRIEIPIPGTIFPPPCT